MRWNVYVVARVFDLSWSNCFLLPPQIPGSLPGFDAAEPSDADVQAALSAMAIQDDGTSKLDYFIQAYRAGDFPFYADYAVHRATEVLAGPRQIVVTK